MCLFQPCHVIYTDYRPTPLQHYIFPAGGDGLHLVVDENVRDFLVGFEWAISLQCVVEHAIWV